VRTRNRVPRFPVCARARNCLVGRQRTRQRFRRLPRSELRRFKFHHERQSRNRYDIAEHQALLQLYSTTEGFLPPLLTTANETAMGTSLPTGLVVYNTTNNELEASTAPTGKQSARTRRMPEARPPSSNTTTAETSAHGGADLEQHK